MNQTLYRRKSRWLRRLTKTETQIVDILNRAYRRDKTLRPRHIREVNNRLLVLGAYGEGLRKLLADEGASPELLAKIGDNLQEIADLSQGLSRAARRILGFELGSLHVYQNHTARPTASTNSAVQNSLDKFTHVGEDEDSQEEDNDGEEK